MSDPTTPRQNPVPSLRITPNCLIPDESAIYIRTQDLKQLSEEIHEQLGTGGLLHTLKPSAPALYALLREARDHLQKPKEDTPQPPTDYGHDGLNTALDERVREIQASCHAAEKKLSTLASTREHPQDTTPAPPLPTLHELARALVVAHIEKVRACRGLTEAKLKFADATAKLEELTACVEELAEREEILFFDQEGQDVAVVIRRDDESSYWIAYALPGTKL